MMILSEMLAKKMTCRQSNKMIIPLIHQLFNTTDPDMIRWILQNTKIDLSTNENRLIVYACIHGHTELVQILLEEYTNKVDPSDRNNSAIQYSSENGHTKIVELLLKDGRADPSAEEGYLDIVQLLCTDDRTNLLLGLISSLRKDRIEVTNFLMWKIVGQKCVITTDIKNVPKEIVQTIWKIMINLDLNEAREIDRETDQEQN